jgi:hypothetical protein
MLTDSGGFQAFSLAERRTSGEDGFVFRSHLDGAKCALSPEVAMQVQGALGADIAMQLDICPPGDAPRAEVEQACRRTTRWAKRCLAAKSPDAGALRHRAGRLASWISAARTRTSSGRCPSTASRSAASASASRSRTMHRCSGTAPHARPGAAPLPDGRRHAARSRARDRRGRRHVRLRAPHAQRPQRPGAPPSGAGRHQAGPLQGRPLARSTPPARAPPAPAGTPARTCGTSTSPGRSSSCASSRRTTSRSTARLVREAREAIVAGTFPDFARAWENAGSGTP